MFTSKKIVTGLSAAAMIAAAPAAFADVDRVSITAADQVITDNSVIAKSVYAEEAGWLVLHSVKSEGNGFAGVDKAIGYAKLDKGLNENVAILSMKDIEKGDRVVLMVHSEDAGDVKGEFEYMSDYTKDRPVTVDGNAVMMVIKAE